jgi:broad specificity phosphatase PhoE
MIRHGRPEAGFTADPDPGLDELGHSQAEDVARVLLEQPPLEVISSPLKRAVETAQPLARQLGLEVAIDHRLAEVSTPGLSLEERGEWLHQVLYGSWAEQSAALLAWRRQLHECLLSIDQDTAVFSHFVAINAVASQALLSDAVTVFLPDHCSVTVFESDGAQLSLVKKGAEIETKVR